MPALPCGFPLVLALALAAAGCTTSDKTSSTGTGPLPPCASAATNVSLGVGAYAAYDITADSGCAVFPANASTTDSAEYLAVVQAAGGPPGDSAAFQVAAEVAPLSGPAGVTPQAAPPHASAQAAFDDFLAARARRLPPPALGALLRLPGAVGSAAVITPPVAGSLRSFSVCSDLDCSTYKTVTARALTVGAHVALYEDTLAPPNGLSTADVDSLSTIFDQRVFPLDTAAFGSVSDVDSNGVVIVLLTPVVNALVPKPQCDTAGYVTGFFDASDLDPATAAQHNDGEVFYGVVPDPAGTDGCALSVGTVTLQLPVTFAHEFEHMINFVQHVLVRGGPPEDTWLDEALAKYAEELTADSYLPGDSTSWTYDMVAEFYNAFRYLEAPEQHFLLAPTDQHLPDVGAGWLFMRWLVDQMGTGITRQLVQTTQTGTANLAAHTGLPFATLDERWALANWVSDLPNFTAPAELQYVTWPMRVNFDALYLADPLDFPRAYPLVPATATPGRLDLSGSLRAGSGIYVLVHQAPRGGPDTLHVNAGGTPLPASLVPQFAVIRLH